MSEEIPTPLPLIWENLKDDLIRITLTVTSQDNQPSEYKLQLGDSDMKIRVVHALTALFGSKDASKITQSTNRILGDMTYFLYLPASIGEQIVSSVGSVEFKRKKPTTTVSANAGSLASGVGRTISSSPSSHGGILLH